MSAIGRKFKKGLTKDQFLETSLSSASSVLYCVRYTMFREQYK